MVTSREWLVARGLAKPSRGRLSREAQEALKQALADGMVFDDRLNDGSRKPVERVARKPRVVAPVEPKRSSTSIAEVVTPKPKTSQVTAPVVVKRDKRADGLTTVWGIDIPSSPGGTAAAVVFMYCYGCGEPIMYCKHKTPKLPKWLTGVEGQDALIVKPTAKDLANV